jgi:hypothetical protein
MGIIGFLGIALLLAGLTAIAGIAVTAAERAEVERADAPAAAGERADAPAAAGERADAPVESGAQMAQTNHTATLFGLAVVALIPGLLTLWLAVRSRKRKLPEWEERVRFAERAWLCHKCGGVWEP